jgi:hypothetical protein
MENITIRDCHPIYSNKAFGLVQVVYPSSLILKNISIINCSGYAAFELTGSNIIADNVKIDGFTYFPGGVNNGKAFALIQNQPLYCNGSNVITNLQVTNCTNHEQEWPSSPIIMVTEGYGVDCENTFINATIADNVAMPIYGGAMYMTSYAKVNIINSVFNNNFPYSIHIWSLNEPCQLKLINTLIGPCPSGEGLIYNPYTDNIIEYYNTMLDSIPNFNFTDPSNPYSLLENSPCVDGGTLDFSQVLLPDEFVFPLIDLAGNPRIYGDQVDMGSYEWNGTGVDDNVSLLTDKIQLSLYPNPVYANGSKGSYSFIEFTLPKKAKEPPSVDIYNLKGQKVRSITINQSYNDMVRKAGLSKEVNTGGEFYSTVFDCKDMNSKPLASGIYLVRVNADGRQASVKITIIR